MSWTVNAKPLARDGKTRELTRVLGARYDASTMDQAAAAEAGVEYQAIPGTTHFLQIEKPRECIAAMESFLRAEGVID